MKLRDLSGQRFGRLTAIKYNKDTHKWLCACDCGNTTEVLSHNLTSGHTKSCGCFKFKDLSNQRFGKLVTIKYDEQSHKWLCACDCGNFVSVRPDSLVSGNTRSCGCLFEERIMPEERADYKNGTQISKIQSIPTKANKSGVVGVNWDKSRGKWQAGLRYQGHKYNLGRFDNIGDAIRARKEAEKKYFKDVLTDCSKDPQE